MVTSYVRRVLSLQQPRSQEKIFKNCLTPKLLQLRDRMLPYFSFWLWCKSKNFVYSESKFGPPPLNRELLDLYQMQQLRITK